MESTLIDMSLEDELFEEYQYIKKSNDLIKMETLYKNHRNKPKIIIGYAKMLYRNNRFEEAINVLKEEIYKENYYAIFELGNIFFKQKKYDEAIKIYEKLLDYPNKNLALFELANIYYITNNLDKSEEYIKELLKIANEKDKIRAYTLYGHIEFKRRNNINAKKYYELSYDKSNENTKSVINYNLSIIERYNGNLNEEKRLLKKVNRTKYKYKAYLRLGKIEKKESKYDKAIKYFKKLEGTTYEKEAFIEISRILKIQNNIDEARYYLKRINDNDSLFELGKLEENEKNYDLAKYYFEQLLDTEYNDSSILELGKIASEQNNYDLAEKYFISLFDTNIKYHAYLEMGKLRKKQGNNKEARKYFTICYESGGYEKYFALTELGRLEKELGNFNEAKKKFQELYDNGSYKDKCIALLELGSLEKILCNYNTAEKLFEKLFEIGTEKDKCYSSLELGKTKLFRKKYEEARAHFNYLCNSKSNYQRLLGTINIGRLEEELGNFSEAEKLFKSLFNTCLCDEALVELGKLKRITKNYDLALEYLDEVNINKNKILNRKLILEKGLVYKEIGNYNKARQYFNKLLDTPYKAISYLELGRLEKDENNLKEALNYFKKAYEYGFFTFKEEAKLEIAKVEYLLGNKEKSVECFNELLESNCKNEALKFLIINYIIEDDIDKIVMYLNICLKENIEINKTLLIYIYLKYNIIISNYDYNYLNYTDLQLIDYDPYTAIEYIIKNDNHTNIDKFKDVDIYKLFNEVNLKEEYLKNDLSFCDIYLVPYDNVGYKDEDYVKVITTPKTKNIINMYPVKLKGKKV